jgi:hypothetical protein
VTPIWHDLGVSPISTWKLVLGGMAGAGVLWCVAFVIGGAG